MLSNAYFLAKFRFDTAKNEPAKNLQNFANFPNFANLLRVGLARVHGVVGRRDHDEVVLVAQGPGHGAAGLVRVPVFRLAFSLTFGEFLVSFERVVLGCIEADFCKQILV